MTEETLNDKETPENSNNAEKKDEKAQPVVIGELERLVYQQQYQAALAQLFQIFNQSEQSLGGISLNPNVDIRDEDYFLRGYTRLASVITTLFSFPDFQLNASGFHKVAVFKKQLAAIFELSGFRGTDHVLGLISNKGSESGDKTEFSIESEQQLVKFLLFYSLGSEADVDYSVFLKFAPHYALPAYISLVAEPAVLKMSANKKREKLLTLGPLLEDIPVTIVDDLMARLSNLWMLCSYAEAEHKHDIKKHLNVILRRWIKDKGAVAKPLPETRQIKDNPVLMIGSEHFTSPHAMFRCYAPVIKQLREKFKLVSMAEEKNIDDVSSTYFDEIHTPNFVENGIQKLINKVEEVKPDIIYYSSLGMSHWALFTANLRLAPIQILTMGHPATSNSPCIDYVILPESAFSYKRDCFSEKVILIPDASFQFHPPIQGIPIKPRINSKPNPVRIAVPSKSYKLSPSFMAICKRILEKTKRPIEYHFFPNDGGMVYQQISQQIYEWVPKESTIVYPMTDYNTYVNRLNQCDIQLSPFPFGGTNSNVDSMRQGIPMITLAGDEPHSRTDLWFFALNDELPKWLAANSEEEYEEAALRLIHNDDERLAISQLLLTQDFNKIYLDYEYEHHPEHAKDFLKIMDSIYLHHEKLQASEQKVWTFEEMMALGT